jgi:hypothetical protein
MQRLFGGEQIDSCSFIFDGSASESGKMHFGFKWEEFWNINECKDLDDILEPTDIYVSLVYEHVGLVFESTIPWIWNKKSLFWNTLQKLFEDNAEKIHQFDHQQAEAERKKQKIRLLTDVDLKVLQPKLQKYVQMTFKKDVVIDVRNTGKYFYEDGVEFWMSDLFETEGVFTLSEKQFTVVERSK